MPKIPQTPSPTKSRSRPPSTPKKKRFYLPASPVTPSTDLATPNGPSISRTEAKNKYKVKTTDLDTIKPISRVPNRVHMGGALIQTYNECDVAALARRVRPGKPLPELAPVAGPSSPVGLANKNGPRIMRTTAMKEFKLTATQMDQLSPISMTPNGYGTVTKYYNRCDVENLKFRLEQLRGASSSRLINFDGLDCGDAASLLAEARR
ncbi:hypothetical protein C8R45DRAFT_237348 [Mycena sanguinolenta]|nr:hypothetical protein C8R45DRAFT_237348 [Mycena sanguinolenta]